MKTFLPAKLRSSLIADLRTDDCILYNLSSFRGEPATRGLINLNRRYWLDAAPIYEKLDDNDLLALALARGKLYEDLLEISTFYGQRRQALRTQADAAPDRKLIPLQEDNKALMQRSLTPSESAKTVMGLTMRPTDDMMRNTLELTVDAQIPEAMEISQAVSGSNIPSKEMDRFAMAEAADALEFAPKLKVADFFIHTRYNPVDNKGVTHWRTWCVGLLSPENGRILLVDNQELDASRFWAIISDHFPIGGVLSTCDDDLERQNLIETFAGTITGGQKYQKDIEDFERYRRRKRIGDLRLRARILIRCCESQQPLVNWRKERPGLDQRMTQDVDSITSTHDLDDIIEDLEEYADVQMVDRLESGGEVLKAVDFDFIAHFMVGSAAPETETADDGEPPDREEAIEIEGEEEVPLENKRQQAAVILPNIPAPQIILPIPPHVPPPQDWVGKKVLANHNLGLWKVVLVQGIMNNGKAKLIESPSGSTYWLEDPS